MAESVRVLMREYRRSGSWCFAGSKLFKGIKLQTKLRVCVFQVFERDTRACVRVLFLRPMREAADSSGKGNKFLVLLVWFPRSVFGQTEGL